MDRTPLTASRHNAYASAVLRVQQTPPSVLRTPRNASFSSKLTHGTPRSARREAKPVPLRGLKHEVYHTPCVVSGLETVRVTKIAAGAAHCLALTEEGHVYSWGENQSGQLGHGDLRRRLIPERISFFQYESIVDIACGYYHSAFLTDSGQLFLCGWNEYKQCGVGDAVEFVELPSLLEELEGIPIKSMSLGSLHSCVVAQDGALYTWGDCWYGQTGHNETRRRGARMPRKVDTLGRKAIDHIDCGDFHTVCTCLSDIEGEPNTVYVWGRNGESSRLGLGDIESPFYAMPVQLPLSDDIVAVTCGDFHTGLLSADGIVYMCGNGGSGQLGLGDDRDQAVPVPITRFQKLTQSQVVAPSPNRISRLGRSSAVACEIEQQKIFHQVACGGSHTVGLTVEGEVYTWGSACYGRLGHGDENDRFVPTMVASISNGSDFSVVSIDAGLWHTIALTDTGDVLFWGTMKSGQFS